MNNLYNKIKQFVINHKTGSIVILIIILIAGYWLYGKMTSTTGETRYVTAKVEKSTIVASITGTGQVSALNQIDIKPKASGEIVYLPVQAGQQVGTGTLIAKLDTTDAEKTVRDAQTSLESAKLALEKLKIQDSKDNMDSSLTKVYSDSFNTISTIFLNMPSTITGIRDILAKENMSDNVARQSGDIAINYRNTAETAYYKVTATYEKNKNDFIALTYNSPGNDIDTIISETYNTTNILANAIKNLNDYTNYLSQNTDRTSDYSSYQNTISGYTTTVNGFLSNLLTAQTNIKNAKDTFLNSDIDVQSSELSIKQKENALQDAKDNLSNYYVYAPFGGTLSAVSAKRTDSASSGTTIATLITDKQVAEISLNEVDAAKVQIGQKTTLTFDAIPDLTIAGKIAEIDSVGTVSSGVVNYTVKISFDTSDARVKPGMSVNATIITNVKQNILTVPNGAIKTQNGTSYVETFSTALATPLAGVQGSTSLIPPTKTTVEIGIANDTNTEITSGLNEGNIIVTKTITGSATTTATTAKTTSTRSILSGVGGGPRN